MQSRYMEEEFLSMVKFCVQGAKKNGMFAYLYDEDRWSSIFIDEPQFPHKTLPGDVREKADMILPYPESVEQQYQKQWLEGHMDHCARRNMVLMDGKPVLKIGVIHPAEK